MIKNKSSKFAKRYQFSYRSKDSSSGSKSGVFDWKKVSDVSFFSPVEGRNIINIIPYTIKTKNHPLVRRGEFDVGDLDYVLDIFVHRNIGPSESTVLCLKSTLGKPCPICEQSAILRKQGKEKEANELKASRRVVYNIQDMKEPDKLKIFETSHFLFEKELIDESRDEEGGFVDFADPDDGKEIKFRCSEVQNGAMKFKEFKSFSFEDRDEPIPEELIEKAISFDEILKIPTYDEVEKILFGSDDCEDEEIESKKVYEEVESNDEDETEEVKPSKPMKSNRRDFESKCPFGHNFGVDCDCYNDCDDCDNWDKCFNSNK